MPNSLNIAFSRLLDQSQQRRQPMLHFAEQLADTERYTVAEIHVEYAVLQPHLIRTLQAQLKDQESPLREYDPVLANQLEDGSFRLCALLEQFLPHLAALRELSRAELLPQRYALYLDWNLIVAECFIHWDLVSRVEKLLQQISSPTGTIEQHETGISGNTLAHCRRRVHRYCAAL
ncbi:hypothetical protein KO507_17390 [Gilvimarinus agarilyticus]|uniref:hypothetical protein n=1 Tax=unclassified Gilvimarinus TaxID=2642066 RepID=UPI001C08CD07|nr:MULTISPECIES: hypothetical protein [unclassified Gilvimarinus]MBU2887542.1 hypothetical protein [Gilvimarinus agarilyticus]MDO6572193.1 hypothetical protein [Gilvimarinus sp. 2_MG-2023]MDO6746757.1 hypothetical protein [Gilvimarinus sp. 1_MG-2023]